MSFCFDVFWLVRPSWGTRTGHTCKGQSNTKGTHTTCSIFHCIIILAQTIIVILKEMLNSTSGLPFVVAATTPPKILGIFKISGPPLLAWSLKSFTRPTVSDIPTTYPQPLMRFLTIMIRGCCCNHAMCGRDHPAYARIGTFLCIEDVH